jgi:hypothetical protein
VCPSHSTQVLVLDFSSSELANASQFSGHNIFNPANSSTAKKAQGTWSISYGDGSSASGDVYTDTVTVADIAIPGQGIHKLQPLMLAANIILSYRIGQEA